MLFSKCFLKWILRTELFTSHRCFKIVFYDHCLGIFYCFVVNCIYGSEFVECGLWLRKGRIEIEHINKQMSECGHTSQSLKWQARQHTPPTLIIL